MYQYFVGIFADNVLYNNVIIFNNIFLLLTWISYSLDLFGYTLAQFWRLQEKVVLVTEYWTNFEMLFITVQPFLDSLNAYVSVEPLDSRLYCTFTFICMIKE